jgi:hypothetical protein
MGGGKTGGEVVGSGGIARPLWLIVGLGAYSSCCTLTRLLVAAGGFTFSPKLWSLGVCNCDG